MAITELAIDKLNTEVGAARTAMLAGDYSTAADRFVLLAAQLAATPNITGTVPGAGGLMWTPRDISEWLAHCRRRRTETLAAAEATGPFQRTNVTYSRAT